MKPGERRTIPIRTQADLWTFVERNVSLWDLLDFFPADAVGPRGPSDAPRPYEVKALTVDTDLDFAFETDIQYGTWMFRPRSPKLPGMMRWCKERSKWATRSCSSARVSAACGCCSKNAWPRRSFRVSTESGPRDPGGLAHRCRRTSKCF